MDLLQQAFIVMSLGMGITFAFLAIVIAGVNLAARIIHAIEGAPREEDAPAAAAGAEQEGRRLAAAVAAALHRPAGRR